MPSFLFLLSILLQGNHYVVDQKACRNKWSGTSPPVINPADWNTKSFFCAENAQAKKSLCRCCRHAVLRRDVPPLLCRAAVPPPLPCCRRRRRA